MTTIEDRLRALGDALDVPTDDRVVVDGVVGRIDPSAPARGPIRLLRIAAAVALVVALVVAAVPSSRRTVADWFGLDGVRIERRPGGSVPAMPDTLDRGPVGSVVAVDGDDVLVSEFVGTLGNPAIEKVATGDTNVVQVAVGGEPAIWIDGEPHEVSFLDDEGRIVFEGFAGNTLLWQSGEIIRRLEGFDRVDDAVDYAESLTP